MPLSLFWKVIVTCAPADTVMVLVSNAIPDAVTVMLLPPVEGLGGDRCRLGSTAGKERDECNQWDESEHASFMVHEVPPLNHEPSCDARINRILTESRCSAGSILGTLTPSKNVRHAA